MTIGGVSGAPVTEEEMREAIAHRPKSIASLSNEEWRRRYMREDGTVDVFVEDEFNAGSRLIVSVYNEDEEGLSPVDPAIFEAAFIFWLKP